MTDPGEENNKNLSAEFGEALVDRLDYRDIPSVVGIGVYSHDGRTVIYRDVDQTGGYSAEEITDILEQAQLESLGLSALEELHDAPLRASIRLYDTINVIIVPTDQDEGVVFAHQSGYDRSVSEIAEQVTDALAVTVK